MSSVQIGVDEAGTGSAIADIYACAMVLDESLLNYSMITDSKKLSPKQRDTVYDKLKESASCYGVGIVPLKELDEIGMAKARRLVFQRALDELKSKLDRPISKVIFDGVFGVDVPEAETVECVPKADFKFSCVSAASIVAKVLRDRSVLTLCEACPELSELYGWKGNKGYLSAQHSNAIREHGLSDYHRKSFQYKCLQKNNC